MGRYGNTIVGVRQPALERSDVLSKLHHYDHLGTVDGLLGGKVICWLMPYDLFIVLQDLNHYPRLSYPMVFLSKLKPVGYLTHYPIRYQMQSARLFPDDLLIYSLFSIHRCINM